MKLRFTYFSFLLILSAILWQSNSQGRATFAGEGNTGAPGDNSFVCASCHTSASIQITTAISLKDQNGVVVSAYTPGQTYDLTVTHTAAKGTPSKWGFQCVSLLDNGNTAYNAFKEPASNVKLKTLGSGRQYAEHNNPSSSNQFTVKWTAPAAGSGSVSFYAAGNGVNGNGSDSGDGSAKSTLKVTEGAISATQDENSAQAFGIYPNPVESDTWVRFPQATARDGEIQVFSISGQLISGLTQPIQAGTEKIRLNTESLASGVYLIRYEDGQGQFTRRMIRK